MCENRFRHTYAMYLVLPLKLSVTDPLLCDNESVIRMVENRIEHSRTKHIDIWYYFLRDHSQLGDIVIDHVSTHKQLADIFTKPLDEKILC
jgi:hypothetical protein